MIVGHGSGEVWFDAAKRMDRIAAADLLREVTTEHFGSLEAARICSRWRAPTGTEPPRGASDAMIEFAQSQASDDPGAAVRCTP